MEHCVPFCSAHCHHYVKFHYAIWLQTGAKLVADLQRAEIWPIIYLTIAAT